MAGCLAAAALLAGTLGCAAIVSDSSYPVLVDSLPREASFVVRDEDGVEVHAGTTPETVALAGSAGAFDAADYTVTFRLPGYAEHTARLEAKLDAWYFGNLLFPGLLGLLIDPMLGSMWKLAPHVTATLRQASE